MGNSFQDQLLKAGLVNKQQLNEAKNSKHKTKKKIQNKKNASANQAGAQQLSSHKANALSDQQRAKDREANQNLQAERQKKGLASEIKQLIEKSRLQIEDADVSYKFTDGGKIRQLYVTVKIQQDLASDKLRIVQYQKSYAIIPNVVFAKICERDKEYPVIKNSSNEIEDERYADYQVPDDLIW